MYPGVSFPVPNGQFYMKEEEGLPILQVARDNRMVGSGCSGKYYNLGNGFGVKIFLRTGSPQKPSNVYKVEAHLEPFEEVRNLLKLNEALPGRVPALHSLQIVQLSGEFSGDYYIGVVMEHCNATLASQASLSSELRRLYEIKIQLALLDKKIIGDDIHTNNFLIHDDGSWTLIDAGMFYFNEPEREIQDRIEGLREREKATKEELRHGMAFSDRLKAHFDESVYFKR